MRYEAEFHAFDMLDQIHLTVRVWGADGALVQERQVAYQVTDTIPGQGESDPREWLKDALVAMLEAI